MARMLYHKKSWDPEGKFLPVQSPSVSTVHFRHNIFYLFTLKMYCLIPLFFILYLNIARERSNALLQC